MISYRKRKSFFSSLLMNFDIVLLIASSMCDREEWAWLQSHVYTTNGSTQNLLHSEDESLMESHGLMEFVKSLRAAITHLLTKLNIPLYRVSPASSSQLPTSPVWSAVFCIVVNGGGTMKFCSSCNKFYLACNNFLRVCDRRISTVCTLVSCCSLERRFPCCCCCLPVRTSAPATGLWWASRSMGSPCPCRSLSWVGGEDHIYRSIRVRVPLFF